MPSYLWKRLKTTIPVFFGVTLLLFCLMRLMPGSAATLAGENAVDGATISAALGLDLPLPLQYVQWLGRLFCGDFGLSYQSGQPVATLLAQRIGPSLLLTGSGILLAVCIALPLGTFAAHRAHGPLDRVVGALTTLSSSVPAFFLALAGIYLFAVKLHWLPATSLGGGRSLVLPAFVIAFSSVGALLRQTRSACLEVLSEDYVTTARAKGLREPLVLLRHGFRTALIPILTSILTHIPHILGGSVVVERVFGWPGMGSLLFSAITNRDYAVLMGVTVVAALAVLTTGFLLELAYGWADPRVRYDAA